jgi:hypothetical protein
VGLSGADVDLVLSQVLALVPPGEFRLVGGAASALRGVELSAGDVDVLFRERDDVDRWCASLSIEHTVVEWPRWIEESSQYFASVLVCGERVELSTVELHTALDTVECLGPGPWTHFDRVVSGEVVVPVVAEELRLVTEVARGREARWSAITRFLAERGSDVELVQRGLADCGIDRSRAASIVAVLLTND